MIPAKTGGRKASAFPYRVSRYMLIPYGKKSRTKKEEEELMSHIIKEAMSLYEEGGIDSVWTYLSRLVRMGIIEDGAAEQIAYMVEED